MVKGQLHYRLAHEEDIRAMYTIECLASDIWKEDYFKNELKNSFSRTAVALDEDKIIGFAVAWNVIEEIQLNNIGIHPDYRRRGAATGLLNYILEIFKNSEPDKIIIEVKSSNTVGIDFYRHLGFFTTGVRKKYYKDDDAILMEKILVNNEI